MTMRTGTVFGAALILALSPSLAHSDLGGSIKALVDASHKLEAACYEAGINEGRAKELGIVDRPSVSAIVKRARVICSVKP
jgi:hypothetical protein